MNAAELRDRLRLARTEGVGPVSYRRLLRRFATAAEAIDALPGLARDGGRATPPRVPGPAEAERELEQVARLGGRVLVLDGPDYPAMLAMLDVAPPILTMLGDVALLNQRAVALVGARNASTNGQLMAELLAADLAHAGLVVVSGMARGIDTAAHEGAMRSRRTVACIAGGIDVAYPAENAGLQRRVASEGGAVLAEAPFGTAPQARHFPRRNRIIAGLALGVVVVEAAPRSGSLITARYAADANRELFAVPGSPLDPRCRGSNDLIRAGAHLTESASDVLAHLPQHPDGQALIFPTKTSSSGLSDAQDWDQDDFADPDTARRLVMESLGLEPTPVDDLVRHCQLSASAVVAALLELELGGRVEMLPGNRACRIGEG